MLAEILRGVEEGQKGTVDEGRDEGTVLGRDDVGVEILLRHASVGSEGLVVGEESHAFAPAGAVPGKPRVSYDMTVGRPLRTTHRLAMWRGGREE